MKKENTNIGGQAVIEGVMMRNNKRVAIAVRKEEGGVYLHRKTISSLSERIALLKLPILRGFAAFIEALTLGIQSISLSAEQALEDEEEELKGWELPLTIVFALAAGIGLFMILPTFLMRFLNQGINMPILLNLGEGIIRLAIFLFYILAISRLKDVARVFQYHGAEHKAIACYESGKSLTVDNTRPFSTRHIRCGTSFLLLVMVISILLFSFFGWPGLWERILIRVSLLPVVAGVSYEAIKLASKKNNIFTRIISQPGLWLQHFTTKKPSDDQVEVALCALNAVLTDNEEFSAQDDNTVAVEVSADEPENPGSYLQ